MDKQEKGGLWYLHWWKWELSSTDLQPSGTLGLRGGVIHSSIHLSMNTIWGWHAVSGGKEAAREMVTDSQSPLETFVQCRWIFCSDRHIRTLPPSIPFALRNHAFFLGNGSNAGWVMSSLLCKAHCSYKACINTPTWSVFGHKPAHQWLQGACSESMHHHHSFLLLFGLFIGQNKQFGQSENVWHSYSYN